MQEAIQFLMIGLKVRSKLYRIGQLDPHKPTLRALGHIRYSRSAWNEKKAIKLSAHR